MEPRAQVVEQQVTLAQLLAPLKAQADSILVHLKVALHLEAPASQAMRHKVLQPHLKVAIKAGIFRQLLKAVVTLVLQAAI